jgi:hypothetical protein
MRPLPFSVQPKFAREKGMRAAVDNPRYVTAPSQVSQACRL